MMLLHLMLTILSIGPITVNTAEILFLSPFPAPSHWIWVEHFARELVNRGHHVTAVTNFPTKQPHPNYTEILINPKFDIPSRFPINVIFEMKYNSYLNNLLMWWEVGLLTSEHALNNTKVNALIHSKNHHFDLIVLEQFFHESLLMFAHKFKAPIVTLGTFGYADNMYRAMGLRTPWSFIPHIVLPYKDRMNFWQRSHNTFLSVFDILGRGWHYVPEQQKIAEKYFTGMGPLPSLLELERNITLMLVNSHISTDPPKPNLPGFVDVGGIHIKPVKPLPNNIQEFLDNAKNGAIYFSIGSYVKSNQMPKDKIKMILDAFSRLPQRVLWKYEDSSIGKLPPNVMISAWLPQNDILAHKNIVLFITHGGIFGTQEAIYHGVPLLFMPLYADQHRNTIRGVNDGFGESIDFSKLSTELFLQRIRSVIGNKSYAENVKRTSVLFRDNLVSPMDEAMYRIEYVIRHKGASHLKSAAIHLTGFQYLMLDISAVFIAIVLVLAFLLFKIGKSILNAILICQEKNLFKKKQL